MPIIDSSMTLPEALAGKEFPGAIRETLTLVDIQHYSFDGHIHHGQLVIHHDLVDDAKSVFEKLLQLQFPIAKMIPISVYAWDDNASMADNNSSAFNYRVIALTDRLSNHSFGRAIDINPVQNPYTQLDGEVVPQGAVYNPTVPGTLIKEIVDIFKSYGFEWGGDWERKDWQHFQKAL